MPEQDEATLNPYGLIGYELVAVTMGAAIGRLAASMTGVTKLLDRKCHDDGK